MKYERWRKYWFNHSENYMTQVLLVPFWTILNQVVFLLAAHHYDSFHGIPTVLQANPMYSMSSWTKLCLNDPKTALFIHLKKIKDLSFTCDSQDLFYFNINYLIPTYFTFIHFTIYLTYFFDSILKLY